FHLYFRFLKCQLIQYTTNHQEITQRYNNPYVADKLSATGICNTISHYKSPNKQAGGRYCR
ncbi:hypothetical protein, partial [Bacteroides thetaiotaomicron]|uniref:hypothetical protein n=1 Tax=Bacteroides thetaiotaomicron TaxID=818 RepID=UPI001D062160